MRAVVAGAARLHGVGAEADQQVWQLVAYVQSMSGLVPQDAAPGRSDDLAAKEPELRKERVTPKQTGHR